MFEIIYREGINVLHLNAFWKIIYIAPLPSFDNTELHEVIRNRSNEYSSEMWFTKVICKCIVD